LWNAAICHPPSSLVSTREKPGGPKLADNGLERGSVGWRQVGRYLAPGE
jgi:hypothetical protein